MNNRFILLSGSASRSCSDDALNNAIAFVKAFTREVLNRGGGLVILAGDESQSVNDKGLPLIFDWVVLREIQQYVESTADFPGKCARLVMSDQTRVRIRDSDLQLLSSLEHKGVVEVRRIRSEEFTGGRYRSQQILASDAMVAIGGGKGTYICGTDMIAAGKPVLPLDYDIGALSEDGHGASLLHKELMQETARFFSCTHADLNDRLDMLTLRIHSPSVVAQRTAELLSREMEVCGSGQNSKKSLLESIRVLARRVTWDEAVKWGGRIADLFRSS